MATTEYLYKILVVGDIGTGKTSIIKRYVHDIFSQTYKSTIGVDFALKVLQWDSNTIIRLQLWDIAGQERFGNMTRVYYKEAVAAIIVFDITRLPTFEAVQKWKSDIEHKVFLPDERPIPCILLANKSDLGPLNKTPEEMQAYCEENGFVGWFETSAKQNTNIEAAMKCLVEKILENHMELSKNASQQQQQQSSNSVVTLTENTKPSTSATTTTTSSSGGCCKTG